LKLVVLLELHQDHHNMTRKEVFNLEIEEIKTNDATRSAAFETTQ
jgi:hypothetical protein